MFLKKCRLSYDSFFSNYFWKMSCEVNQNNYDTFFLDQKQKMIFEKMSCVVNEKIYDTFFSNYFWKMSTVVKQNITTLFSTTKNTKWFLKNVECRKPKYIYNTFFLYQTKNCNIFQKMSIIVMENFNDNFSHNIKTKLFFNFMNVISWFGDLINVYCKNFVIVAHKKCTAKFWWLPTWRPSPALTPGVSHVNHIFKPSR